MAYLYLWAFPQLWLDPSKRREIGTNYGKWVSHGILRILRWGGARFDLVGTIRTDHGGVILGNHQTILEPPALFAMSSPWVPRFVARARYLKAPLIGGSLKLVDCAIIDPKKDRVGAVSTLQRFADGNPTEPIAIFPEGHRSTTGAVLPFRPAGLTALLTGRRVPVVVVVTDGAWHTSKFVDVVFRLHKVRLRMEVVEEVLSPDDPAELPEFIEARRTSMIQALARMRGTP